LRNYGCEGQLGLEKTPEEYVAHMVEVFREVRRVLKNDGTLWLNLGDSYAGSNASQGGDGHSGGLSRDGRKESTRIAGQIKLQKRLTSQNTPNKSGNGLKPKDLVGIPWRVAFALQADGWWLRQDIIWAKPNPMPESVRDRCTKSHEYIFMLTKSARYRYDAEAVSEPSINEGVVVKTNGNDGMSEFGDGMRTREGFRRGITVGPTRNRRSVWTVTTKPCAEAHFATFPPEIPELCIKAGRPKGGTVLDPFFGAGTTGLVALRLGREFIGIELNPAYCEMARKRIYGTLGQEMAEFEKKGG
jgi:DNA modification methylase